MTLTAAYEHVPGLKGLHVLTCVLWGSGNGDLGAGEVEEQKIVRFVEGVMYKLASSYLCR